MKSRYFGFRGGWLTFWITVACATDMTLFGYDQGVFGGVIVTKDFLDTLDLHGKTSLQGTITAIYDIGCFFGAIAAYFVGDWLGRKKTVLVGTTIMSVGALLQITTYSVGQIIAGRIIAGIGNGINTATAPPWQAETSKASWRGKLIVVELILNIVSKSMPIPSMYNTLLTLLPIAFRLVSHCPTGLRLDSPSYREALRGEFRSPFNSSLLSSSTQLCRGSLSPQDGSLAKDAPKRPR